MDSIYKQYPIGQVLVWRTYERIHFRQVLAHIHVGETSAKDAPGYVLDGQQRLTTLLGVLWLPTEYVEKKEFREWQIFFDLDEQEFRYLERGEIPVPSLFPMNALLNTRAFIRASKSLNDVQTERAEELAERFTKYRIPVVSISSVSLTSAVEIFARLNSKGTPIRDDELATALTYRQDSHADTHFRLSSRLEELGALTERENFGKIESAFLLKSLLAALEVADVYRTSWETLFSPDKEAGGRALSKRDQLEPALAALEQAIPITVRFLKSEGIRSAKMLSYNMQFVMLTEFFRNCPSPDAQEKKVLSLWLWTTSYQCWFGGANSARIRSCLAAIRLLARRRENKLIDVGEMVEGPAGPRRNIWLVSSKVPAEPFPEKFDLKSARLRAYIAFYLSLNPLSLTNGQSLDVSKIYLQDAFKALVYVSRAKADPLLLSSPANRLFLRSEERSDVRASIKSLGQSVDHNLEREVLASHAISQSAYEALKNDQFEAFLRLRQDELQRRETEFIKSKGVVPPNAQAQALSNFQEETDDWHSEDEESLF